MTDREPPTVPVAGLTPPVAEHTQSIAEVLEATPPPPRRKRRRGVILLVSILVFLALLVVAWIVAENYARQYANDYVRDRIVEVLALPADAPVDVDLGEGSIILQSIRGSIDDVAVDVRTLGVGDLSGSASISAMGVPLDSSLPVDTLRIELMVPEDNLSLLSAYLSGVELDSVELEGESIRIATELSLFGVPLPIAVGIEPSAADGQLVFAPVDIELNGDRITVEELNNSIFGGVTAGLLQSQSFCVASFLPESLVVDEVSVDGDQLVVAIDGDGAVLGGPGLATLGTCPG